MIKHLYPNKEREKFKSSFMKTILSFIFFKVVDFSPEACVGIHKTFYEL
jgi:hypothetical protein